MAIYYVWSGAAGSGTGASWANAFTTLTTAFTTEVAGDTLYVAHDHSESSASVLNLTSSGSISNPTKVICVDRAGTVPPVSADRRTTAQIATTTNSAINLGGNTHYDGIIFLAGNSTGAANIVPQVTNTAWTRFDNCSLRIGSTGAGKIIVSTDGCVEMNNTTASFSAVSQGFTTAGVLRWSNTASALIGAQVPTTLFLPGNGGLVECIGVDLSAAGSGKTICGSAAAIYIFRLIDCKLHASVTKDSNASISMVSSVDIIRSGAAGVNYAVHCLSMPGTLDEETTIVRTGGASDGTTPIAWKIISSANCNYSTPLVSPPIARWNDTDGSAVTATVEGIWGGGAVPLDDEIWLEVEYLGDNASPMGSFVNDGKANLLATAANQTSSSETWGGSTTKFKLAVTFTAQQVGWIYARVKVGKASSTFYIDPLVTLT